MNPAHAGCAKRTTLRPASTDCCIHQLNLDGAEVRQPDVAEMGAQVSVDVLLVGAGSGRAQRADLGLPKKPCTEVRPDRLSRILGERSGSVLPHDGVSGDLGRAACGESAFRDLSAAAGRIMANLNGEVPRVASAASRALRSASLVDPVLGACHEPDPLSALRRSATGAR